MAELNLTQIKKTAELIKTILERDFKPMNFYSFGEGADEFVAKDMYPNLKHSQTINFFTFVCLHQFGFWYGDDEGYVAPLYGTVDEKKYKGSDLLFRVCMKALMRDETVFEPYRLNDIAPEELANIFSDDNGPIPFPDWEARYQITRAYGKFFVYYVSHASDLVYNANSRQDTLHNFIEDFGWKVPGFKEDGLDKKTTLLSMALSNRPEHFLSAHEGDDWKPIIDYHHMRIHLRLGNIDLDSDEEETLSSRSWVTEEFENEIRNLVYDAEKECIKLSGRSMWFNDHIKWRARKYCPEMEQPDCSKCSFNNICAKNTELFQPVFRTTAY